jgi:hypothetical protein
MVTRKQIEEFLGSEPVAMAGVSRNPKKFGFAAFEELKEKGMKKALMELEGSGINYITKECILMHYKPHSIHKFHAALKKFFNRFPK